MYLTIDEVLQKLGFTYRQLMEAIKAGHIKPYLNRNGQSQPIQDAIDIAELATLDLNLHNSNRAEYDYFAERQLFDAEEIHNWKFLESTCDPAIIGVKSAPKKTVFDRRAPIILKAIENLGMAPMSVMDKKAVLSECLRLEKEEFKSLNRFEETWSEGSKKGLWRHANADKASSKNKTKNDWGG